MKKPEIVILLEEKFNRVSDFCLKDISLQSGQIVWLAYLRTMVNHTLMSSAIMEPLKKVTQEFSSVDELMESLHISGAQKEADSEKVFNNILSGFVVAVTGESTEVACLPCVGFQKRAIQEPPTSTVLKGPREGFGEDLDLNLSLIRRRLKTPDFKNETIVVGKYTNTTIAVCYLESVADEKVVKKVKKQIRAIDIDGIVDSFYVQSILEERKGSLFKQVGNTEKPDIAVAKMLEGRIAIVVEGSPIVLTVPYLLLEDFQSSDDYYTRPVRATFSRVIRMLGIFMAIGLPGLYVAMESFHYALLPLDFLINLQASIKGISFPPLLEILFVIFLFEILNEASIRMPKYLGMALSIVGALVLGETAVQAGIISSPSVIIIAISGITLYTVPDQVNTASVLRVIFTIVGGVAGFYGLIMAFLMTIGYLMTFNSYGTPYFAPFAPFVFEDQKDAVIKVPLQNMTTRPKSFPNKNRVRQRANERY